jgi:hypothetical protein
MKQLLIRESGVRNWLDVFVHSLPGGGKTGFLLSSYWERSDPNGILPVKRGGPLVLDFDKGGADATAASMGLAGKIPIIEPVDEEQVIYILTYPEKVVEQVHATPGFEDYQVDVFGFDTLSSMEDLFMGEPKRATGELLPASNGSGLMAKARRRDETFEPAIGDYKALISRTKAAIRLIRAMPFHTITTCHTSLKPTPDSPKGLSVPAEDKTLGLFPNLIGDENRFNIAKLHDAFLYMEQRGGRFYTHTQPRGGAVARTRFQGQIKPEIENLKFWDLVNTFNGLRQTKEVKSV